MIGTTSIFAGFTGVVIAFQVSTTFLVFFARTARAFLVWPDF